MLNIVATPIGNLSEMSIRAIDVLKSSDYVLCEDTRTSSVLLNHYDIKVPLVSYHKFNERSRLEDILNDLKTGKVVSLISDAGMPAVSDPGNLLVQEVIKNNLEYTVISGPSAFLNAFVLSGFSTPFSFFGFLPERDKAKKTLLTPFINVQSTLIFYVSPHSLSKDLKGLHELLGKRKMCIVREISKKFESVYFLDLGEDYTDVEKGEFVVLLAPKEEQEETIDALMKRNLAEGLNEKQAMKATAELKKISKSDVYKNWKLKGEKE